MPTPDWKLILEFLKVLLTWPPLAALMLAVFFRGFSEEIRIFLQNVRPKLPGTDHLGQVQPVPLPMPEPEPAVASPDENAALPSSGDDAEHAEMSIGTDIVGDGPAPDRFRYLNQLLVLPTQRLLDALVLRGSMSILEYQLIWPELSAEAKSNMLTVLYQNGLASVADERITVTPRGRLYAEWPERVQWVNLQSSLREGPRGAFSASGPNPGINEEAAAEARSRLRALDEALNQARNEVAQLRATAAADQPPTGDFAIDRTRGKARAQLPDAERKLSTMEGMRVGILQELRRPARF